VIAGIFPHPKSDPVIHVRPKYADNMYLGVDKSPRLQKIYDEARQTESYQVFVNASAKLASKFNQILNANLSIDRYFDIFQCRRCHSKPLPCGSESPSSCVSPTDMQEVFELAEWWHNFEYALERSEEIELRVLPFYDELMANAKSSRYQINLYSCHDTNLMALLKLLGQNQKWPPYSSSMQIETWELENEQGNQIRVFYNGELLNATFALN
jgi:hypothetical protein